jgi:hypothetical protein
MDIVKKLPNGSKAILAISKSSNAHILAFYWNESLGTAEPLWILRDKHTMLVQGTEQLTELHKLAIGLQIEKDEQGRLELRLAFPIADKRKLYLVDFQGDYVVVFRQESGQICQLHELFIDILNRENANIICRCKDLATKNEFIETLAFDIGPLASFF